MAKLFIKDNVILDGSDFKDKILEIPESIKRVGKEAFRKNNRIEKVIFNANCEKIEDYAFYGCENLREIVFPDNSKLRSIGEDAFSQCPLLRQLIVPKKVASLICVSNANCEIVIHDGIKKISRVDMGKQFIYFLPDSIETLESYSRDIYLLHKKDLPKICDCPERTVVGVIMDEVKDFENFKYIAYEDNNGEKGIVVFHNEDEKIIIVPQEIDGIEVKRLISYNKNKKNKWYHHRYFLASVLKDVWASGYFYFGPGVDYSSSGKFDKYNSIGNIDMKNLIVTETGVFVRNKNSVSLVCCTDNGDTVSFPKTIDGLKLKKVLKNAIIWRTGNYGLRLAKFPDGIEFDNDAIKDDYLIYNIGEKTYSQSSKVNHIIDHPLYNIKADEIVADKKGVFDFLLVEKDGKKEAILLGIHVELKCMIYPAIPKTINGYKVTMASIPFGQFLAHEHSYLDKDDVIKYFKESGLELV